MADCMTPPTPSYRKGEPAFLSSFTIWAIRRTIAKVITGLLYENKMTLICEGFNLVASHTSPGFI